MKIVDNGAPDNIQNPYLIEGLPGAGLVAKISADYIIEKRGMEVYAEIFGDDLPWVSTFEDSQYEVRSAVTIFADKEEDLLVLRSDIPISSGSKNFLRRLMDWMYSENVRPIFQLGMSKNAGDGDVYGVSTVEGHRDLQEAGIEAPPDSGGIMGPTGALIQLARRKGFASTAVMVGSKPVLPDPEAAETLINEAIMPMTGVEIDTGELTRSSEKIKEERRKMARRINRKKEGSSKAYPNDMYR